MMQMHAARQLDAAVRAGEVRFKHDAPPGAVAPGSGVIKAVSARHVASVVRHHCRRGFIRLVRFQQRGHRGA